MRIFLIIFDTLRKDHTGKIYGNNWIRTPHFDQFVKDSIVFEKAYPESLPTIPVRRSLHTGIRTFPFNQKDPIPRTDDIVQIPGWQPIPSDQIHIAEYLKSNGFTSSFITSTYHQFKPNMNFHLGFDQWNWIRGHEDDKLRIGFYEGKTKLNKLCKEYTSEKDLAARAYQKRVLSTYFCNMQYRDKEEKYFPAQTFNKAIEFVKETRSFNNIFCLIDEFDPHEPWDPPEKYLNLYLDENYEGHRVITPAYRADINYLSSEELKFMRASYAGEVSLCDTWFGYFIEELKNMELYNESLIILSSDHGHSIGEHNATGKIPMFLYPELVDIPMIIKPPGNLNGPKRIKKSYVYNHDILPTIFGFLGKEKNRSWEGLDLSVFLNEHDHLIDNRDYITCGFSLYTLYKDDHYAIISSNDQSDQKLFDLYKDPEWNINIAENNKDICKELFNKIEKDAKGELLLKSESILGNLKDWYIYEKKKSE